MVVIALSSAVACKESAKSDADIAKAFSYESKDANLAAELDAKDAARRKAAKEAADAADKRRAADIDAVAIQPAEAPATLDAACEAVVQAYDVFMKSGAERDVLLWSDGHRMKLAQRRAACLKMGMVAVAGCEVHALSHPPDSVSPFPRDEAGRMLMERCHEKFGDGTAIAE